MNRALKRGFNLWSILSNQKLMLSWLINLSVLLRLAEDLEEMADFIFKIFFHPYMLTSTTTHLGTKGCRNLTYQ